MTFVVYTDGSSLVKDQSGGWAWWVDDDLCDAAYEQPATNNTMEMTAVLRGLLGVAELAVECSEDVMVVSDSAYVIDCLNDRWYVKWRLSGWRNSMKKAVANRELWEDLIAVVENYPVPITFQHCRGHGRGGPEDAPYVEGNKVADYLAGAARKAGR